MFDLSGAHRTRLGILRCWALRPMAPRQTFSSDTVRDSKASADSGSIRLARMSVPYTPPLPVYIPLEELARRIPNLGYQVYLASEESTSEIEAQVRPF